MIKIQLILCFFLAVEASKLLESEIIVTQVENSQFNCRSKRSPQPEGLFGAIRDFIRSLRGEVNGERDVKKSRVFKLLFGKSMEVDTPDPSEPNPPDTTPFY